MVSEQERSPEGSEEAQRACVLPVMLELVARMGRMTAEKVATVAMTMNVDGENSPSPKNIP